MKKHHYLLIGFLAYLVLSVLFVILTSFSPFIHKCDWEDCEQTNRIFFESKWGFEEYTDGWCVEKTHFNHPDWSYEQCEDYVFTSPN